MANLDLLYYCGSLRSMRQAVMRRPIYLNGPRSVMPAHNIKLDQLYAVLFSAVFFATRCNSGRFLQLNDTVHPPRITSRFYRVSLAVKPIFTKSSRRTLEF